MEFCVTANMSAVGGVRTEMTVVGDMVLNKLLPARRTSGLRTTNAAVGDRRAPIPMMIANIVGG